MKDGERRRSEGGSGGGEGVKENGTNRKHV